MIRTITAEVTIDIDEKRRVWSTASGELGEVGADGPDQDEAHAKAATALSIAAATGALQAYEQAKVKTSSAQERTFKSNAS